jgi:alpha-methylacyl-CoA racemase
MKPEFDYLNRSKHVLSLDLKTEAAKAALFAKLANADVLLEGFRPGVLERLGLDPTLLLKQFPKLVIGRLSGWGNQGPLAPRAGHDINYLALTGALLAIGKQEHPVPPLNLVADFGGGAMHLVVGVLARLVQRGMGSTPQGGIVETSIVAGTHGLMPMFHGMIAGGLHSLQREANLLDGAMPFYRVYKTASPAQGHEQFVALGALEPKFYAELLKVLELTDRVDVQNQYNSTTWAQTAQIFTETIAQKSRDEWEALANGLDCCLSPVLSFSEAPLHPHNKANNWHSTATEFIQFKG